VKFVHLAGTSRLMSTEFGLHACETSEIV